MRKNGVEVDHESLEEVKIDDIRARSSVRPLQSIETRSNVPYLVSREAMSIMTFVVPSMSMWAPMVLPMMPLWLPSMF